MKNKILIVTLAFVSCGKTSNVNPKELNDIDELIKKSDSAIVCNQKNNIAFDSVATATIHKTKQNIDSLHEKVAKAEKEKQVIKVRIKEKTIVRVDTVYIETKKNFWGRTKTKTTTVSDTTEITNPNENDY